MLVHNFRYALKALLKNKMLIFWTFAFPIILGTFFQMAFSDIEKNEKLETIPIAIVENQNFLNDRVFSQVFQKFDEDMSDEKLFEIEYAQDENLAKKLLEEDKVCGYLLFENQSPKVVVKNNGINQTVFRFVVEEILTSKNVVENIVNVKIGNRFLDMDISEYERLYQEVSEKLSQEEQSITDISSQHLSYTMIEFYTLIAMTCLYGGMLGMTSIHQSLPNMSSKGKRVSVGPTPKGKILFSSILASFIVQLVGVLLLFLYTVFVLHVDYGTHLGLVLLLSFVGSLAGLSLGVMVATVFPVGEDTKTGILIAITMFGCFLSGMMGITMKYVIDKNIPIVNKLNPANMITDGFYSLYYYDTLDRFYFNLVSLFIFSVILFGISLIFLRRQKYDSV